MAARAPFCSAWEAGPGHAHLWSLHTAPHQADVRAPSPAALPSHPQSKAAPTAERELWLRLRLWTHCDLGASQGFSVNQMVRRTCALRSLINLYPKSMGGVGWGLTVVCPGGKV